MRTEQWATKVEFPEEGGILTYYKGEKYPYKGIRGKLEVKDGIVGECAVAKSDAMKGLIDCLLRIATKSPLKLFLPLLVFPPLRKKILNRLFNELIDFSFKVFKEGHLPPNLYCRSGRELHRLGEKFVARDRRGMGMNLVEAVCMVYEYSTTYRYICQDFFNEIRLENLRKRPRTELMRVSCIVAERSNQKERFEVIKWLIILWSLAERKTFREIVNLLLEADFGKLRPDQADYYHMLLFTSYNFQGKSFQERYNLRKQIDAS